LATFRNKIFSNFELKSTTIPHLDIFPVEDGNVYAFPSKDGVGNSLMILLAPALASDADIVVSAHFRCRSAVACEVPGEI
jgi:hypothetical protein